MDMPGEIRVLIAEDKVLGRRMIRGVLEISDD
jgi:hypothetical protein